MTGPHEDRDFQSDDAISNLLTENSVRHQAPDRLRQKISRVASEVSNEARWMRRQFWKAGLVGALAASLVLFASLWGWEWFNDGKDPYDIVAQESRSSYKRLILEGELEKAETEEKFSREAVLEWVEKDPHLVPKGRVPGIGGFHLDTGRVIEISGQPVAEMVFKFNNLIFLVTVIKDEDDSDSPDVLKEAWTVRSDDSYQTVMWSKGSSIYALSGEGSYNDLISLSKFISP